MGGLSAAEQHVLWWGGLRGALGLALALSLPAELPLRNEIVVVTFGVVAFSIIVQGLTMPLLLRWLGFLPARKRPFFPWEKVARAKRETVEGCLFPQPVLYSPAISAACSRAAKTLPLKLTLSNCSPAFSAKASERSFNSPISMLIPSSAWAAETMRAAKQEYHAQPPRPA